MNYEVDELRNYMKEAITSWSELMKTIKDHKIEEDNSMKAVSEMIFLSGILIGETNRKLNSFLKHFLSFEKCAFADCVTNPADSNLAI